MGRVFVDLFFLHSNFLGVSCLGAGITYLCDLQQFRYHSCSITKFLCIYNQCRLVRIVNYQICLPSSYYIHSQASLSRLYHLSSHSFSPEPPLCSSLLPFSSPSSPSSPSSSSPTSLVHSLLSLFLGQTKDSSRTRREEERIQMNPNS